MRALVYKDLVTARTTLLLALVFSSLTLITQRTSQMRFVTALGLCVLLPVIVNAILFAYDAQCQFEVFAFSAPLPRRAYVLGRYLSPLLFALLGGLITWLVIMRQETIASSLFPLLILIAFAIPIVISCLHLPFLFQFGSEKGQLIYLIVLILFFAAFSLLGESMQNLIARLYSLAADRITGLCLATALLICIVAICSVWISFRIVRHKEY